jgi:hypothetical protein
MDNKLKDYLMDAHGKFPDASREGEYNVLVVGCDDPLDIMQWEGYLIGSQGLFTDQSYAPTDEYSNVDMVVLTNLYHRHKAVEEKDKLTAHWWFGESFSLLYKNPRSTKPDSMAQAFAKTLQFYNNDLVQYRMAGDAPERDLQSLAIPHFVGKVLLAKGRYLFQPGKPRKLESDEETVQAET